MRRNDFILICYSDDGIAYGYEKEAYFSQSITARADSRTVVIGIAPKMGAYMPPLQSYLCKIHGYVAKAVQVNGQPVPTGGWGAGKDIYGAVTWIKVKAGTAQKIVLHLL